MNKKCCGFDCNQGRDCPLRAPRDYRADKPTVREWIFVFALLALGLTLSAIPFYEQEESLTRINLESTIKP